jgi:hypothetical protein
VQESSLTQQRLEFISNLHVPKTQKDEQSCLGHVDYYKCFIENITKIASPLFKFLTKDNDFFWTNQCQKKIEALKEKLYAAPVLQGPNWSIPFHI